MIIRPIICIAAGLLFCDLSRGETPLSGSPVRLRGIIIGLEDISAVARIGSFLAIGSDEAGGEDGDGNYVQLLEEDPSGGYRVANDLLLFKGDKKDGKEMDIEGIAVEGNFVYVVGSHSLKRGRIRADKKYARNRDKLLGQRIEDNGNRFLLYRLTIDPRGKETDKTRISLRDIIGKDPVLAPFSAIPGKENGVDIEGLAAKNGWLYIGFRSPLFRGNYVPIMKLQFNSPPRTSSLSFVQLDGLGIRGMAGVSDGFLLLAGPPGDGPGQYRLYHWDGKDMIPGRDRPAAEMGRVRLLGEIRPPEDGKAEGVAVMEEGPAAYDIIVVYDGVKNADNIMERFRISKK